MTKSERALHEEDSLWADNERSIVREEPEAVPIYDLEERTARFGEAIIDFAKRIPRGPLTDRIIDQLVGAGTSVGANYTEADDSVSKKEFLKCIGTCKKEASRSKTFSAHGCPRGSAATRRCTTMWTEARALHLIFARIWRTGQENKRPA